MEVMFLGTGAGSPSKTRNTQSMILDLRQEIQELWMMDCGEGCQHQILNTSYTLGKVKRIFITHLHGDHIFGLFGAISSRSFQGGEGSKLFIYGPIGIKKLIDNVLKITGTHLNYPIEIIEVNENDEFNINRFVVKVKPLQHTIKSFGYIICQEEQLGSIKVDALKNIGLKPGPLYKEIKTNNEFTHNGKTYLSKDFMTDSKKGINIAVLGDTMYFDDLITTLRECDIIIMECTYLEGDHATARKYGHIHLNDIRTIQSECQMSACILTHLSNRYNNYDLQRIINDSISTLPYKTYLASDFKKFKFINHK